jgi:hypothetical protein
MLFPVGSTCQWHTESVCPTGFSGPVRWAAVTGLRPCKSLFPIFFLLLFLFFLFYFLVSIHPFEFNLICRILTLATYVISLDIQ